MKSKYLLIVLAIGCLITAASLFIYGQPVENFTAGEIIDNVVCLDNSRQSYALYLPSSYSADKQWPVIYIFDPAARGALPVELFKKAAETYGYIIVSSNNARNGPWKPIYDAAKAVWLDSGRRFSIDRNRVYASGFSGGSRVASTFKYIINQPTAGIIGCGAGLGNKITPEMVKPALYYGIVGIEDFNYREMMKLDQTFDEADLEHRFLIVDGPHRWPEEAFCTQAVEWMEINGIKQGKIKKNDLLVTQLYKNTLNRAQNLEQSGRIYYAVSAYEALERLFRGLLDVTEVKDKGRQLRESNDFKKFRQAEEKRNKKELEFIRNFAKISFGIKKGDVMTMRPESIARELKMAYLQKEAAESGDKTNMYDRALARRLLQQLNVNFNGEGTSLILKKDHTRGILFLEIAARAGNRYPLTFYNLACAYSMTKNKKKALHYFKRAIESGFTNLTHIEKDKDLDFIRKEKAFKEILRRLNK